MITSVVVSLHFIFRWNKGNASPTILDLFDLFIDEPHLMPKNWNIFKDEFDKYTKVSDYISGMTDKFAINTHSKFFDLYSF